MVSNHQPTNPHSGYFIAGEIGRCADLGFGAWKVAVPWRSLFSRRGFSPTHPRMDREDLRFFNPYANLAETANRLPHWQQTGAVYFITFRLGDSIPSHLLAQWENERAAWLSGHPQTWTPQTERTYHERFTGAMERWLDAGHGPCALRDPAHAAIVGEAFRHFDGSRVAQLAWIVMPNHIHAVFVLHTSWTLEQMIHSWKRFTAQQINARLGREGPLWMRDYFDRLVRDDRHLENCVRYIRRNPAKAHLHPGEYLHYESELARAIE